MQQFSVLRRLGPVVLLVTLFCLGANGQLRIEASNVTAVPQQKAVLLFDVACQVVAKEFRLRHSSEVEVPVTLVLGEDRDGVVGDESQQVFTIYMSRWDETLFATSVSRIALQHLLSGKRKAEIVREILRRANLASTVSVEALRRADRQENLRAKPGAPPPPPHAVFNLAAPCSYFSPSPFPAERGGGQRPLAFCPPETEFAP
jgi:hypothetical protein